MGFVSISPATKQSYSAHSGDNLDDNSNDDHFDVGDEEKGLRFCQE